MPRPRKCRNIALSPDIRFFKPQGVKLRELKQIVLMEDGLEALRLADGLNLSQEEAALKMNISRSTFSRLVAEARKIVADALTNGWAIKIESEKSTLDKNERGK